MTPQDLIAYIEGLIIDNTTQQISPYKMRAVLVEMVNSLNQSNISSLSAILPLQYDPFTNTLSLPVVNDLTTGGTNSVLSAEQGKILKGLIDAIVSDIPTLQEVTDAGAITDNEIEVAGLKLTDQSFLDVELVLKNNEGYLEGSNDTDGTVFIIGAGGVIFNDGVDSRFSILKASGELSELLAPETLSGLPETIATEEYVSKILPSNLILYPTTAPSDISGYVKMVTDIHDPSYNTTAVDVSTGAISGTAQLIASLVSSPGLINGNPGTFNTTTIGNITRTSGSGTAEFFYIIYKRTSAGVETMITQSSNTIPVLDTGYSEFSATALWNDGSFILTDSIVIKYYANRISGGSNPTYNFQFGGMTPVRTLVPIPLSVVPTLPIDEVPIDGSTNAVQSNGVFDALVLKADKSMSAYSMRANNTGATANATETNFRFQGSQALTGITWTGVSAPTGGTQSYQWQQVGNQVTATFTAVYAVAGVALTQLNITLPTDMPTPIKPSGVLANAGFKCYTGLAHFSSSSSTLLAAAAASFVIVNATDTTKFDIASIFASSAPRTFYITITYFT